MGKMITNNIQYELIEVDGKLGKELQLVHSKHNPLQMTPYGIATLARDLAKWAISQCPDTAEFIKKDL